MKPTLKKLRRKMLLQAAITIGCLFETVGCPQLLGNAIKDGTRSFFDFSLTTVFLSAFDLSDDIFGDLTF